MSFLTLHVSAVGSKQGSSLLNLFGMLVCLFPVCAKGLPGEAVAAPTSPWFLPSLIFLVTSLFDALWVIVTYSSLLSHSRVELEYAVYVAAIQALLPPLMPIVLIAYFLIQRRPVERGRAFESVKVA
jgi:hypothetical protein